VVATNHAGRYFRRMHPALFVWVGLVTLLAIIPGADTALVTRSALTGGRRAALFTTFGVNSGCAIHATASALGLSAILRTSAMAYMVVKGLGALYLIWLGARSLLFRERELEVGTGDQDPPPLNPAPATRSRIAFLQGLLTNILNPKVAIFYLTVLPQFIGPGDSVIGKSLELAAIHIGIGTAWLSLYAYFLGRFAEALRRPGVRKWMERTTGAILLGLGVRLAWERR
jgi:threonine/homoserine/homoserine lactone efflux protein